jgi:hypothetical protein
MTLARKTHMLSDRSNGITDFVDGRPQLVLRILKCLDQRRAAALSHMATSRFAHDRLDGVDHLSRARACKVAAGCENFATQRANYLGDAAKPHLSIVSGA